MPYKEMWIVTQVAPYLDGPAGVHATLPQAEKALYELGVMHGLHPEIISDVSELTPTRLELPGILALFTIGETPFTHAQQRSIEEHWLEGRIRIMGVHSATDACHGWDAYGGLLGGRFSGHPWTQDFEIEILERDHPATAHLGERWSWTDEIYLFTELDPGIKPLIQLADGQVDMSVPGARKPSGGFPLAWCHTNGHGKTFYSALGHFPGAWETPTYLRFLGGGLEWLVA